MENPQSRQITDLISDPLRELPREHARPGFTARVLAGLDAEPRQVAHWTFRLAPAKPAILAAALLAIAVTAGALIEWRGGVRAHRETVQARQTLEELRAEHGRLQQELRAISETTEPPVVYLGGDEKVDYVLDLGKVRDAQVVTAAAPAAYHIDTF